MYKSFFLLCILLISFDVSSHDFTIKKGFANKLISNELISPTSLDVAPDGRIFVTEKNGKIKIIENGKILSKSFVHIEVDGEGERGISGILLDKAFDTNGYVYVYYTAPHINRNRVSRFTAAGNLAIPESEIVLIELDELGGTMHNGGTMRWQNDSTLLIGVGDGLKSSESGELNSLFGKFLRIHKNGTIPTDNPFYEETTGKYRAIYARGFRNPFTFDLHEETGQVLINDVAGNEKLEEINELEKGKHYGWPGITGPITTQEEPENYKDPFYYYDHDEDRCAVVGGAFYNPTVIQFPDNWNDKYLFSDYCTGIVHMLNPETGEVEDTLMSGAHYLSNMVVSNQGYLYYLMYGAGELWEVQYVGDGSPYIARQPRTKTSVVGENIEIEIGVVGDEVLNYKWYKDDILVGGDSAKLILENVQITDDKAEVYCHITNHLGSIFTDTIELNITKNKRPEVFFTEPILGAKYQNGDSLKFSGYAIDPEEGNIPNTQIEWTINFHHDLHFHPAMEATSGIEAGAIFIPKLGETSPNVWYRIHLKATDSKGLSNEKYIDVQPNLEKVHFLTNPSGLKLNIDGAHQTAPFNYDGVTGNQRIAIAPQYQYRNDSVLKFNQWSDETLDSSKTFLIGDFNSITAQYNYVAPYYPGSGSGLHGTYYKNIYFNEPAFTKRIDPEINFNLGFQKFMDGFNGDSISVFWHGSIQAPFSGKYKFTFIYDDNIEVSLNGVNLLVDNTQNGGEKSFEVNLNGGIKYNLTIKFIEQRWLAVAKMFWEHEYLLKEIVPRQFLYPDSSEIVHSKFLTHENPHAFPNPTNSLINIVSNDSTPFKIVLFNSQGQYLTEIKYPHQTSIATINVGHFTDGIYYFQILSDKKKTVGKFLKISH